jgi:hypothetical protein
MPKVLLFSNCVKRVNATEIDSEKIDDIIGIVKQAVSNGAREIYFNYEAESGQTGSDPASKASSGQAMSRAEWDASQAVSLTETSACSQDQKQSEQSEISEPDYRAEVGLYPNQQVSNSSKSTWDDQDVRTHYPLEAK